MAKRVNLDAMIPRADLAIIGDDDVTLDLFQGLPINNLQRGSPIQVMLRKPDFQRETNHWTAIQIATFIASFLDNELIPSLILWNSKTHIFVIDGGHRLSALRAWIEDDYGDGPISNSFYKGEISEEQKKIAKRARVLIEKTVGRYSNLASIIENNAPGDEIATRRARNLFKRAMNLQWVQGSASVAESSFFKINNQGTPLDDTEEMLLRNRRKSISIAARSIIRSGTGHKYWSTFSEDKQRRVEALARDLFDFLFEPEVDHPLKTLDLPLGGSASPVDALSLLIETLIAVDRGNESKTISGYPEDDDGSKTISVLESAARVLRRITGNGSGSLGLHPAVYFYNERGKHSRFLFLGTIHLVADRLSNNDSGFFKKFAKARKRLEKFLIEHKSTLGLLLQNMSRGTRVRKIRDLLKFLVDEFSNEREVTIEQAIQHVGARGRILDITGSTTGTSFSDDTKSSIFIAQAIHTALECPICGGLIDPTKSVSYDHKTRVRDGGKGGQDNAQLAHPYCNDAVKN
jgi:hypothetical protein